MYLTPTPHLMCSFPDLPWSILQGFPKAISLFPNAVCSSVLNSQGADSLDPASRVIVWWMYVCLSSMLEDLYSAMDLKYPSETSPVKGLVPRGATLGESMRS